MTYGPMWASAYHIDVAGITPGQPGDVVLREQLKDRMVAAFARTAATIAWEESLQVVLDRLAGEVLAASNAKSCAIALVSRFGNGVDLFGAAGYPDGYVDRINEALELRTPMVSLEAYRSRVKITRDMASTLASDPRFAPYAELARSAGWTTIVSVPLIVREERVGALTALFNAEHEPDESDVSFLNAMADHGAIAIHTARLIAESKEKAAMEGRNRMARDMHDAISQSLFSMRLRTKALQIAAGRAEDPTGKLLPGLAAMETIVNRAVEDMRALVLHLRPPDLRATSLAEAIKRYTEAICDRDAYLAEVRISEDTPSLPHATEQEIYHIAREAIGNAVDHAHASRLEVDLGPTWHRGVCYLRLQVIDDGIGFKPDKNRTGHIGISSMRSRASEFGAELTIDSTSNGTTVRLDVPVPTIPMERPR